MEKPCIKGYVNINVRSICWVDFLDSNSWSLMYILIDTFIDLVDPVNMSKFSLLSFRFGFRLSFGLRLRWFLAVTCVTRLWQYIRTCWWNPCIHRNTMNSEFAKKKKDWNVIHIYMDIPKWSHTYICRYGGNIPAWSRDMLNFPWLAEFQLPSSQTSMWLQT